MDDWTDLLGTIAKVEDAIADDGAAPADAGAAEDRAAAATALARLRRLVETRAE